MTAPTEAQQRIITAALELFGRHGVGGTSLQMIADEIGVTKAAVYHQYPTKDQIVLATAEFELSRLDTVLTAAEAEPDAGAARDVLLRGMVDLAIDRRRSVGNLLNDPAVAALFAGHQQFHEVLHRLRALLGRDDTPEGRLQVTMVVAAISGATLHPFARELDDDVLREQLLRLAVRFLDD